jgi:ketosteroid isomerase-like protein
MASTVTSQADGPTVDEVPSLAVAGRFVDALVARDFDALAGALTADVSFRALLPRRVLDLRGREAVRPVFAGWFASAERWDVLEVVVGEVGGLVHLRWRVRLTKPDLGPGAVVVEQQVYARAGADGSLRDVALLCTGFRPDAR